MQSKLPEDGPVVGWHQTDRSLLRQDFRSWDPAENRNCASRRMDLWPDLSLQYAGEQDHPRSLATVGAHSSRDAGWLGLAPAGCGSGHPDHVPQPRTASEHPARHDVLLPLHPAKGYHPRCLGRQTQGAALLWGISGVQLHLHSGSVVYPLLLSDGHDFAAHPWAQTAGVVGTAAEISRFADPTGGCEDGAWEDSTAGFWIGQVAQPPELQCWHWCFTEFKGQILEGSDTRITYRIIQNHMNHACYMIIHAYHLILHIT